MKLHFDVETDSAVRRIAVDVDTFVVAGWAGRDLAAIEHHIEELAALGGDIASVHERHSRLLHGNMRLRSDGWGMVNAAGCSEVGFWPLYFGDDYFILIVSGMPRFNQEAFTTLVWALGVRYGRTSI